MDDLHELLASGIRQERAGNHARALREYQLVVSRAGDPALLAEAWRRVGDVRRLRCEWQDAEEACMQGIAMAEAAQSPDLRAQAQNALGAVCWSRGEHVRAREAFNSVLDDSVAPTIRADALQNLGSLAAMGKRYTAAEAAFFEALFLYRQQAHARGEALVLNNLGSLMCDQDKPDLALPVLVEAERAAQRCGDLDLLGLTILNQSEAYSVQGAYDRAHQRASEAVGYFTASRNRLRRVGALRTLGDVEYARGDLDQALHIYRTAHEEAVQIGAAQEVLWLTDRQAQLQQVAEPASAAVLTPLG
jgi:tetratricopeptide (TPR) repeat protein